jgi:hypothetical protein
MHLGIVFSNYMISPMISDDPPFNLQKNLENAKKLQQTYEACQQHIARLKNSLTK